jgi:hypothetical protein
MVTVASLRYLRKSAGAVGLVLVCWHPTEMTTDLARRYRPTWVFHAREAPERLFVQASLTLPHFLRSSDLGRSFVPVA